MRRALVTVSLIAGLVGACFGGDGGYVSYLDNQQSADVLVVFDGQQADGLAWTQEYIVPGLSGGWVARGPDSYTARIVAYRQPDCAVLGDATLEFGQLLITVPKKGSAVFHTEASIGSLSGPYLPLQTALPSGCAG